MFRVVRKRDMHYTSSAYLDAQELYIGALEQITELEAELAETCERADETERLFTECFGLLFEVNPLAAQRFKEDHKAAGDYV